MSDNIFQILLLSAYLDIALISITIAVFAISVSYLGRETSRSILRRKDKVFELKEIIASLSTKIKDEKEIDSIHNEIAYYKKQQRNLERNLFWLSVKGSVFVPTSFFSVSLLLCALGILETFYPESLLALSSVFIAIGGFFLGKTLKATESAALELPKPKFELFFRSSELATKRCKVNVPIDIRPVIHNTGDVSSESPLIVMCIPKGLDVKKTERWTKAMGLSRYKRVFASDWTYLGVDVLNVDGYQGIGKLTIVAKQAGKHRIHVEVKERTGRSEHELILEAS